jgi:hypothetical protein
MNDASPKRPRRRGPGRIAAVTAAALGATLLALPGGTAAAQTVDCAAYGPNPDPLRERTAIEVAVTCGIEVPVSGVAWHHATVTATPEGQFHLVSTAEPVQDAQYGGIPDPTLVDYNGSLTQNGSDWTVFLGYTDQSSPLIETPVTRLDWTGETPVPEYVGTTAVYDELAAGLGLTVDMGVTAFDLKFTAADASAWSALSSGLHAESDFYPVEVANNGLHIGNEDSYHVDETTPFLVRDADGETHRADLTVGEDGAVMIGLLDQTLAEAAYPLTLTTTWTDHSKRTNNWGTVTSASPDLPLYRGAAGLGTPYFELAGQTADTVAGPYCDAFIASDCLQAEAGAYWEFGAAVNAVDEPSVSYEFDYPVTSATFTVDAAEGADCVAPDLNFTEAYTTATTWNQRPAVTGPAASGSCQDGTAVYDLTQPIVEAWGDFETAEPITLGTAATAQTARFEGGSARLDVYFDIAGINANLWCSPDPANPDFHAYSVDGGLYAEMWREDLLNLDATWTVKVTDPATGQTVLTTEPAPVPDDGGTVGEIGWEELEQGTYMFEYEVSSSAVDFTYTSPVCHGVVDRASPAFDVKVVPGSHQIGDTVSIEVTLDEQDFVNDLDTITVSLESTAGYNVIDSATLTEAGTVTLEAALTGPVTRWWVRAVDRSGNDYMTSEPVGVTTNAHSRDYNGDRLEDLLAVRESDGALLFYAGNGDGTFDAPVSKGSGWGGMDVVMAGDLTADGRADVLARDTRTGTLYTYPGNGSGGLGTRITVGTGWNAMGLFTSGGDFNGDGDGDLYAVGKSDGKLYFYDGQGNGSGKFNPRVAIGTGWGVMDAFASVGDLNADGNADLYAHDSRTGLYHLYAGDGSGNVGNRTSVPASLDGYLNDRYSQIAAAGDLDRDGKEDLLAVDSRTGELELHTLTRNGTAVPGGETIANGWGGTRLAAVNEERTYDYNGDGHTDVLVRRGSDGKLYFYSGNGSTGFGPIGSWGTDLKNLDLIETAGDLNGDGFSDLIGRVASTGSLYLFPGKGNGTYDYAARVRFGTGWNSMSAIVSGHDYDGDGRVDIIAREQSTGYLWLYPGKGNGYVGTRKQIGTGWNGMREITAIGDLDHDGHADIMAIRSSDNCMYFYGGRGDGTLKAGVQTSCNWVGYDQVAAVGDFNGDGHADWIARRKSDGALYLYKGNGAGGYSARTLMVASWSWANAIA